eukprot:m.107488 g.107488  ORF g.107488 m.107488 type:complete len:321 (-) comp15843_c0_seq4:857-1819(-)
MAFAVTPQQVQFSIARSVSATRTRLQAISSFCDEMRKHCRDRVNILQIQAQKRKILYEEKDLREYLRELVALRSRVPEEDLRSFEAEVQPLFDEAKIVQAKLQKTLAFVDDKLSGVSMTTSVSTSRTNANGRREINFNHNSNSPMALQLQEIGDDEDVSDEAQVQNAREMRALEHDMEDLLVCFENVLGIVHEQGQHLDEIAANMSSASAHVTAGTKQLIDASKMRSRYYPVLGAVVGGAIAGPVGMWAGMKLVGLTAIAGASIGTLAGSWLKSKELKETAELEQLNETSSFAPLLPKQGEAVAAAAAAAAPDSASKKRA